MANVVFKVSYNDDLRRRTVSRSELNIGVLERKIRDLYFPTTPTTPFITRYLDEDDDLVTLETQDDLDEALRSGLDKLRLFVSDPQDGSGNSSGQQKEASNNAAQREDANASAGGGSSSAPRPPFAALLEQFLGNSSPQAQCFANMASAMLSDDRAKQPLQPLIAALQAAGVKGDLNAVLTGNERCQNFLQTVADFAPRAKDVCEGRGTPESLLSEFISAVSAGQGKRLSGHLLPLRSVPHVRRRVTVVRFWSVVQSTSIVAHRRCRLRFGGRQPS